MSGGWASSRPAVRAWLLALAASLIAAPGPVRAGKADVVDVVATCTTIRTCDFQVKVLHADVGQSHYADRFEIVTLEGEVLGTRVLRHPHVHEQPFVRGLVGVEIPEGVSEVVVRARDSKHGLGGRTVTKTLEFPVANRVAPEPGGDASPQVDEQAEGGPQSGAEGPPDA